MIDVRSYDGLGELLHDALIMHKSNTAFVELSRKREASRWSYLDARHAAQSLTGWLAQQDIGPGDRVAIIMSNQPRWLLAAIAVFARGAILVPLDYKLQPYEHDALLAHSGAKLVVAEFPFWRKISADTPALVSEAPRKTVLPDHAVRYASALEYEPYAQAPIPRAKDDVATIVYSSGTGGAPKGCMLTHGAYTAQLGALLDQYPMEPDEAFFSILPTNHAIDFLSGFVGPLACGARIVHQRALRPEFLLWSMKREQITHMAIVPLILEAFERSLREKLDALPTWKRRAVDALASVNSALTETKPRNEVSRRLLAPIHAGFGGRLKMLFCGGAFVDRDRAEFFYRLGLPVVIGYGLTEACTVVTLQDLAPFRADGVGRTVAGTTVRIVDAGEDGIGEVQVTGPTLMAGYLDDPEQTAAAFDGEWLRTGDLGWLDASGHLHLVGRRKNMIVTGGGKNVYPEDIEAAFALVPCDEMVIFAANYLWDVREMVGEQLVAVVRSEDQDWRSSIARANRKLPEHKRIDAVLVWGEEFPRTASMKVKRPVLAEQIRAAVGRDALEALTAKEVA
ncbi:MAG: AMP-binding protein [Proteobacteria bacterium]|nr:AMP-binding protein [Pseudomonadota bacterium]